ncbi:MAG TPA: DUF6766 family protein [Actinomycetota bacterium]|nr:DUF6766 family protein [Actinomycetota bacterium]
MTETVIVAVTVVVGLGIAVSLIAIMVRSIVRERRASGVSRVWANFGLSLAFLSLFLVSWIAQALAEWGTFVQEQRAHQEAASIGDFLVQFGQSTFENWQSEFLQLFSFVVFSAILIHRGSAESKDGTDRIEEAVHRLERRLDEAGIGSPGSSRDGA